MPTHLYEYAGVTLSVDYTICATDGIPTLVTARVLDSNYQPCGPDLIDWLQRLVFMHSPTDGESVLSIIAGEIHSAINCH